MSRNTRAIVAFVALVLVAGACSKGDGEPKMVGKPATTASTTSTTVAAATLAPLTGLPMGAADVGRAAVTVKVDNSPEGRPQSGIDLADVVYEEKVEGSVVRFLAIFQSRDAELVGPIRSVRSTDPPIVAPIGGVFVYSGGIPNFKDQIRKVVKAISEDDNGSAFKLRSDKKRPYKTYGSTESFRKLAGDDAKAPPELFPRLKEGEAFALGTPAVKAVVNFGPRTTAQWDYDAATKLWKRTSNGTAHVVEKGGQLAFSTVIIQPVPYRNTGYKDPAGGQVEEATVTGEGDATLLAEGRQIAVRWSKSSANAVTRYNDAATGKEIAIPAGTVWISLPSTGSPVSVS